MESLPSLELCGARSRRRPPLHSVWVSFLAICGTAYARARALDLNSWPPSALLVRFIQMVENTVYPFLSFIHSQFLLFLSFVDDYILAVERILERIFPPFAHVFNKIDQLILFIDILPVKLDDVMRRLPIIIHKVPLLDWAVAHAISLLSFFVLYLGGRGQEITAEKEILMDMSCSEDAQVAGRQSSTWFHGDGDRENVAPATTEIQQHESEAMKVEPVDGIEEEDLNKRMKEDVGNEEVESREEEEEGKEKRGGEEEREIGNQREGGGKEDSDQILELFEAAWLSKQA